ncbi:hypothetical protein MPSEU_000297300 [Mayamaea pseudoterrestris]|nr:hypothetical protein MPSEU_000297300 [Mayamaea pseudoterrestris]
MLPSFVKIDFSRLRGEQPVAVKDSPPKSLLCVDAETRTVTSADDTASLVSAISDAELVPSFRVYDWDKKRRYSDFIKEGLEMQKKDAEHAVMLFESPSSSDPEAVFYNCSAFRFHDYPIAKSSKAKHLLGPLRYGLMNGTALPTYLKTGQAPTGLLEHWENIVPGFETPRFVAEIAEDAPVYAYLPCESIKKHVNDGHVHFHLAGKDAIHLMCKSSKTTNLLPNTKVHRPCIAKTTHSMASKGIFIIRNDEDERGFEAYLEESGHPAFVVTTLVDIDRNAACHFFIHPTGEVTWFGSNENHRREDGSWSMDSYLIMKDQDVLKEIQLPFVKDVAEYCLSLGFWGFCGIDVLFDAIGQGYLVDVNPRVTGSCPSLMVAQLFQDKYGFEYGLFRRNGDNCYYGSEAQLFAQVAEHNATQATKVVVFSCCEIDDQNTKVNIGVYGDDIEECKKVVNQFAKANR